MNRLLCLLLLLPLCCSARNGVESVMHITKDSLKLTDFPSFIPGKYWRFHKGDSLRFADSGYNDSNWQTQQSILSIDSGIIGAGNTKGNIDWYRMHLDVDSSAVGLPLAVGLMGKGAFEIYLDGSKIDTYGLIKDKNSAYGCRIINEPFIIVIGSPGKHLLAVRYAAYKAQHSFREESPNNSGFITYLGEANKLTQSIGKTILALSTALSFFMGIFLVLAIIHLLLFLYYPAIRSNLFFCIFCFAVSSATFLFYVQCFNSDPGGVALWLPGMGIPISVAVGYFSFSGLTNELFSRKKTRFYFIASFSILCCVVNIFSGNLGALLFIITGLGIFIEAMVLPIAGIYRKVRGARIVGAGILFSVAFIIFTIVFALVSSVRNGHKTVNLNHIGFSVLGICAIFSIPFSMSVYLSWTFANTNKELKKNLQHVQLLSAHTLEQELEKKQILENQKEMLEQEVAARTEKIEKQHEELKKEKKKSDDLLLNILPEEVADELKQKGQYEARHFEEVTVLFTDFVDFTAAGETMTPGELVDELNVCFKAFDEIISHYSIEKIKTIGDAYLAVCGLPAAQMEHAVKTVSAAQDIMKYMKERKARLKDRTFEVRVGIHSGNVVAGIVGVKKFAYDIWGDTVNTAARMEQNSAAGMINISQTTYELVKEKFDCAYRGEIAAKGKGNMRMYFVGEG